jgi:hypothetical protein
MSGIGGSMSGGRRPMAPRRVGAARRRMRGIPTRMTRRRRVNRSTRMGRRSVGMRGGSVRLVLRKGNCRKNQNERQPDILPQGTSTDRVIHDAS